MTILIWVISIAGGIGLLFGVYVVASFVFVGQLTEFLMKFDARKEVLEDGVKLTEFKSGSERIFKEKYPYGKDLIKFGFKAGVQLSM